MAFLHVFDSLSHINSRLCLQPTIQSPGDPFRTWEYPAFGKIPNNGRRRNFRATRTLERLAIQAILKNSPALLKSQTVLPLEIKTAIKQEAKSILGDIFPRQGFETEEGLVYLCHFCREGEPQKNCKFCNEVKYWQNIRIEIGEGLLLITQKTEEEKQLNVPENSISSGSTVCGNPITQWPECSDTYLEFCSRKHSDSVKDHSQCWPNCSLMYHKRNNSIEKFLLWTSQNLCKHRRY